MVIFLDTVYHYINNHIAVSGDAVIPHGGMYTENPEGWLQLYLKNANNHQITWGIAGAAVQAMATYMQQAGAAPIAWQIWDGMNWVGIGRMMVYRPPSALKR